MLWPPLHRTCNICPCWWLSLQPPLLRLLSPLLLLHLSLLVLHLSLPLLIVGLENLSLTCVIEGVPRVYRMMPRWPRWQGRDVVGPLERYPCAGASLLPNTRVVHLHLLHVLPMLTLLMCLRLHLCLSNPWRLLKMLLWPTCVEQGRRAVQPPLYPLVGPIWGPLWSPGRR